jgi:hypothetical protein
MDSAQFRNDAALESVPLTRRHAALRLGGGGLALLLAGGLVPAAAQEASPSPSAPGADRAYLAIRQYELAPGRTMEELTGAVASGFVPILREVPGFQDYTLVETSEGVISISVFADQAGAEESTRRATDWVQQNIADMFAGPPEVTTGSVWLREAGPTTPATPAP